MDRTTFFEVYCQALPTVEFEVIHGLFWNQIDGFSEHPKPWLHRPKDDWFDLTYREVFLWAFFEWGNLIAIIIYLFAFFEFYKL